MPESAFNKGYSRVHTDEADPQTYNGYDVGRIGDYFFFRKPQDRISACSKVHIRVMQVRIPFFLDMTSGIADFNDQFQPPAIKIHNMVSNQILPSEP
jgi:hypothetical protein